MSATRPSFNALRPAPTYGKIEPAPVPSTNLQVKEERLFVSCFKTHASRFSMLTGVSSLLQRLYIGNLDPTMDEYTVVKLFEPFGKITFLDFLFHWQGVKRGQPRGYCFL